MKADTIRRKRGIMNMKNKGWIVVWLLVVISACQNQPEFINHTPPNLSVSTDIFTADAAAGLGCDEIHAPSNLLGGLEPPVPIAICLIRYLPGEGSDERKAEIDRGEFFYYTGGFSGTYIRYLAHDNGEFVLLKTESDFRNLFAPIESEAEALSYALAVRNLGAYFNLQYDPAYEYEAERIEDTYVTAEADGYRVHLFHDQIFGCGPHWTSEVDVRVSAEGNVEELARKPIFRDPNMDEVCVD